MSAQCQPQPIVKLACTTCQHVYQPQPADFGSGNTGCPLCSGWTWIAELSTADTSMSPRPGGHSAKNSRRVEFPNHF
jgi:hypothetical protein